jgi:hypothetical protein
MVKDSATRRLLGKGFEEYSTPKICDKKKYALEFIEKWTQQVRDRVPKDQLLEFETGKHGFYELAGFLGVDIPAENKGYNGISA